MGVFSAIHEAIGRRVRIGRDPENEIAVDDLLVSRFHAELRERPDGAHELVDLGSRNGTFVNGRAVERTAVCEHDIVTVGHHTFRLVGSGLEEYVDTGSISFEARWRSDSWRNAERLVAARTPAQRAGVTESIERGATGRARLIEALTSNLVTGPSAAVRNAYCERRVSRSAKP
jgi:pSer/pThr/pTyr-binding forkhead associated (FHA) protein